MGKSLLFSVLFLGSVSFAGLTDPAQISASSAATSAMASCPQHTADCSAALSKATTMCIESLSPEVQAGMAIATAVLPAIRAAGGTSLQCSTMGKALTGIQGALVAYTAVCGAAQAYCATVCTKTQSTLGAVPFSEVEPGCGGSAQAGVAKALAACNGYKANLAAGAVGLVAMVAQIKQAKKCEDDTTTTTDCTKTPTAASCVASVDCNVAANSANPVCICAKNPRAVGCNNGNTPGAPNPDVGVGIKKEKDDSKDTPDFSSGNPDPSFAGGSPSAGATGGGLPAGGGGGGAGGGGAAQKGSDNGAKAAAKGLNANILSGDYGGGGGSGGRGAAGGGGWVDPATAAKYKQYMPGGDKDAARAAASLSTNGANEVTGGGGKTNWQKVRERYIDNRGRMVGGGL